MAPGEVFGRGLVTPDDCRHDGLVLGQRLGDPAWRGECGEAEQRDGIVQAAQAFQQEAVLCRAVDVLVKDRVYPGMRQRVVGELALLVQRGLQDADFGRIRAPGGKGGGGTLQSFAHIIQFSHCTQVVLRHGQAAAGRVLQHPIRLQTPQRLADRGAADLQPGGQFEFRHALTGAKPAVLDGVADGAIGLLSQPAGAARFQ